MADFRKFKSDEELFALERFAGYHNANTGRAYKVIARPDPPDGILRDPNIGESSDIWVETFGPWASGEHAKRHSDTFKPGAPAITPIYNFDPGDTRSLFVNTVNLVYEKLNNPSYGPAYSKYGRGNLYVYFYLNAPLVDKSDEEYLRELFAGFKEQLEDDSLPHLGYFHSIYADCYDGIFPLIENLN